MVICIDFDGVIVPYEPFCGIGIFPEPLPGISGATKKLKLEKHLIIIFTVRNEIELLKTFLNKHEILFDFINYNPLQNPETNLHKPLADVYIDDRGLTFQGFWDKDFVQQILNFKPWHGG